MIRKIFILTVLFATVSATVSYSQMLDADRFKMMSEFLSKSGGQWGSQSEDVNQNQPKKALGFGLYCSFDKEKNILRIRNISHFGQSNYTNYERTWYWNAAENTIKMISWISNGSTEIGKVNVVSEKAFVLEYERIDVNGEVSKWREENFINNEREFTTKVLEEIEGEWIQRGFYTWKI